MKKYLLFVLCASSYLFSEAKWQSYGPQGGMVWAICATKTALWAGIGNFNLPPLCFSKDSGKTWNAYDFTNPGEDFIIFGADSDLYLMSTYDGSFQKILPSGQMVSLGNTIGGPIAPNSIVAVGSEIFANENGMIYLSKDGAATWTITNKGFPALDLQGVVSLASNGSAIYALTYKGAVYASFDTGSSWTARDSINGFIVSTELGIAASGNSVVLFFEGFQGRYSRLYISTNEGLHFAEIDSGERQDINQICIQGSHIWTSGDSGIFESTNNGATWKSNDPIQGYGGCFASYGSKLFVGTVAGIFYQPNNGNNWTLSGLPPQLVSSPYNGQIVPMVVKDDTVYEGNNYGLYYSPNKGKSWSSFPGVFDIYTESVTALGVFGNVLCVSDYEHSFVSTDNGSHWNQGALAGNVYSFGANGKAIFALNDSGVYVTTNNGQTWKSVNQGLPLPPVFYYPGSNVIQAAKGEVFVIPGDGNIYLTKNNGGNWTVADSGLSGGLFNLISNGSNVFLDGYSGIYTWVDSISRWSSITEGSALNSGAAWMAVDGNNLFATGKGYIFKTSDLGKNWAAIDTFSDYVYSIAVIGSIIFADEGTNGVWQRTLSFKLTAHAGKDTTICKGAAVKLGDTYTAMGGSPPYVYNWGNGVPDSANPTVVPTATTTYTLTVTDSKGATATSSVNIQTHFAVPPATITANGPTTFYCGDSVRLTANSGNGLSYLWNTNVRDTTQSIIVKLGSGSYDVTVSNANCKAVSNQIIVSIETSAGDTINADGPTTICKGKSVKLTVHSNSGFRYFWSTTATTQTITVKKAGSYFAIIEYADGCGVESNIINVMVDTATGCTGPVFGDLANKTESDSSFSTEESIAINKEQFEVIIYPNPCSNQFHLKIQGSSNNPVEIKIYDIMGRMLEKQNVSGSTADMLFGEGFANGLYVIQASQDGHVRIIKVVKSE